MVPFIQTEKTDCVPMTAIKKSNCVPLMTEKRSDCVPLMAIKKGREYNLKYLFSDGPQSGIMI